MHLEAKERITKGIDTLAAQGKVADAVAMSKATAEKFGIHATHLDWSMHPDAEQMVAEMTAPSYDERPESDPHPDGKRSKPMTATAAGELATTRCQKHMRRDCVLAVVLDDSVPEGKMKMLGRDVLTHAEEV